MPNSRRKASRKFLTGTEVRAWRASREITLAELGEWLDLTPQAISKYEDRGATKVLALALAALDRGLKPFKPSVEDLSMIGPTKKLKGRR